MATIHSATTVSPDVARQPQHRLWPLIVGGALALHGVIHLLGFAVDWRLAQLQTMPYSTTVLADHLDLGTAGIQAVELIWLLAALGCVAVGVGLAVARAKRSLIAAIGLFSLIVCILGWLDSALGAVIDVAILVAIALAGIPRSRPMA